MCRHCLIHIHSFTRLLLRLVPLFFGIALSGCDNAQSGDATPPAPVLTPEQKQAQIEAATTTSSAFQTPNTNGGFGPSDAALLTRKFTDAKGNGYSYQLRKQGTHFSGVTGVLPNADLGRLPLSGFATLSGIYEVALIGKSDGETRRYGKPQVAQGVIKLFADFEFQTLRGRDSKLAIDATFKGADITGKANYEGRNGIVSGKIGGKTAVGVFHGADADVVMTGGFLVEK